MSLDTTKLSADIKELTTSLRGSDDSEETKKALRMAMTRYASENMSPEEKKEARKAFDTPEDEDKPAKKSKKAMNDDEHEGNDDEDKTAKKSKKANEEEEKQAKKAKAMDDKMEEKDQQIAALTASVNYMEAKPLIEKQLLARKQAGMSEEALTKFGKTFYGKSVNEIKQRLEEDRLLFPRRSALIASSAEADVDSEIPFNGEEEKLLVAKDNGSDKTLEELFN